jgi:AhpD family alkylhydroperoxidase
MMTKHKEDPVLGDKDQEIIAVGASVASGCLPCIKFHLRAAAGAGAGEGDIRQAVSDATRVRMTATGIMARAGGLTRAEWSPVIPEPAGAPSMLRELVAVAAAYAVNCATSLGMHMAAARALGATDGQMFAALKIACAIRDVACQKAKTEAGAVLGASEEQAVACDCSADDEASQGEAATCSCRPGDLDDSTTLDKK